MSNTCPPSPYNLLNSSLISLGCSTSSHSPYSLLLAHLGGGGGGVQGGTKQKSDLLHFTKLFLHGIQEPKSVLVIQSSCVEKDSVPKKSSATFKFINKHSIRGKMRVLNLSSKLHAVVALLLLQTQNICFATSSKRILKTRIGEHLLKAKQKQCITFCMLCDLLLRAYFITITVRVASLTQPICTCYLEWCLMKL